MPTLVIIGSQWGDEGKGKIVDMVSAEADVVARYQGGNNAGHTVVHGTTKYVLHLIPSGILKPGCLCLIGNGVVLDPDGLEEEIQTIEALGIDVRSRLFISENAHLVLPYHRLLDVAQEKARGAGKIGTTGRGIGCAYGDKTTRIGMRAGDLRSKETIDAKVAAMAAFYEPLFEKVYNEKLPTVQEIASRLHEIARIVPSLVDGAVWLDEHLRAGHKVLIEGAQGVLLDIDHGTYPYVTSSNPSTGGVCTGLGISPKRIDKVMGVCKAYTTRVGEGPFPTEFDAVFGEKIRQAGGEFGATTGRPRRCGWFDAVAVRRSILVSGIDEIILTKIDVLDDLKTIKIATDYTINGEKVTVFPSSIPAGTKIDITYEEMPGWDCPLGSIKKYEDLPVAARNYIERLEQVIGIPITVVSVGADRDATICRKANLFI